MSSAEEELDVLEVEEEIPPLQPTIQLSSKDLTPEVEDEELAPVLNAQSFSLPAKSADDGNITEAVIDDDFDPVVVDDSLPTKVTPPVTHVEDDNLYEIDHDWEVDRTSPSDTHQEDIIKTVAVPELSLQTEDYNAAVSTSGSPMAAPMGTNETSDGIVGGLELVGLGVESASSKAELPTETQVNEESPPNVQESGNNRVKSGESSEKREKRSAVLAKKKSSVPSVIEKSKDAEQVTEEPKESTFVEDGETEVPKRPPKPGGGHPGKIRAVVREHKNSDQSPAPRSGWNESVAPLPNPSPKERHEAVEKRRQERIEARQQRLAEQQRLKQQRRAEAGLGDDDASAVSVEGGHAALHPAASKPSRSRSYQSKRQLRAQSSTGAAGEGEAGSRIVLPPLVQAKQPRSSPDPARSALRDLLYSSEAGGEEGGSPGKSRRRKPLYLRMIEKAQQMYLEEERQKHEQYVQQRKLKQRNNPTQEELREHRRKHDELLHAKLEESRRNQAESTASNARAIKRQQAVASAVETALEQGGEGAELVVDGTSPLRRRRGKKGAVHAEPGESEEKPAKAQRKSKQKAGGQERAEGAEDHGFSPAKPHRQREPSFEGESSSGKQDAVDDALAVEESLFGSSAGQSDKGEPLGTDTDQRSSVAPPLHVPLKFDASAAAAAVEKIPALSAQAIPAYCASDWLEVLATADVDAQPGSRGEGSSQQPQVLPGVKVTSSSAQVFLRPAPPHSDAQKLMGAVQAPV